MNLKKKCKYTLLFLCADFRKIMPEATSFLYFQSRVMAWLATLVYSTLLTQLPADRSFWLTFLSRSLTSSEYTICNAYTTPHINWYSALYKKQHSQLMTFMYIKTYVAFLELCLPEPFNNMSHYIQLCKSTQLVYNDTVALAVFFNKQVTDSIHMYHHRQSFLVLCSCICY